MNDNTLNPSTLRNLKIPKGKKKTLASTHAPKVIYLPSVYDPKKIREGILEILSFVERRGDNSND